MLASVSCVDQFDSVPALILASSSLMPCQDGLTPAHDGLTPAHDAFMPCHACERRASNARHCTPAGCRAVCRDSSILRMAEMSPAERRGPSGPDARSAGKLVKRSKMHAAALHTSAHQAMHGVGAAAGSIPVQALCQVGAGVAADTPVLVGRLLPSANQSRHPIRA
jgi:hypothetical protein